MRQRVAVWVLLVVVAAGMFVAGRATAGGRADRGGYAAGVAAGHADGLREGRAEQATLTLPANDRTVFESGYAAGAADVFGGYDGGWDYRAPYVIVLVPGGAGITYRIASRTRLAAGVDYYLCPDGHSLCSRR
jgi:hypothetical protein